MYLRRRIIKNAYVIHTAFFFLNSSRLNELLHPLRGHVSPRNVQKACYFYGILARHVPLTPASCFKFILLFKSMATQETLWHLDCMRSADAKALYKLVYLSSVISLK